MPSSCLSCHQHQNYLNQHQHQHQNYLNLKGIILLRIPKSVKMCEKLPPRDYGFWAQGRMATGWSGLVADIDVFTIFKPCLCCHTVITQYYVVFAHVKALSGALFNHAPR